MSDQYQILTIVAGAIRSCRSEIAVSQSCPEISAEELNCIAKAIISALAESGLRIVSASHDDNKSAA